MRGAMLFVAGLFAGLAFQVATAQNSNTGVVMMNHVGISVPNIDEAVTYYTQKMGYREAFRINDDKGQPRIVYMQISKNTFLELNPVTAQRPAGFSHYGLQVENAADAVARFRRAGLKVTDTESQRYKSDHRQHHRPLYGPHRADRTPSGVLALQGHSKLEVDVSIPKGACRCRRIESCEIRVPRLMILWVAMQGTGVQAQQRGGTAQTDKVQPVNSGANPYRVIRDWAHSTLEERPWGGSNGVAIDRDGKSVWATDRCSPGTTPGCLGTKANPVHHFDESGKEIRSFGGGMFVWPHGIHVDRDGNVWVTDARAPSADDLKKFPGEDKKGSVVVKFSPEGKVLMTLGKPGVRGNPPEALTDPTAVVTDPANGDVYVAESHTDVADPNLVGRISVFDKNGKFLRVIGKTGTGPGEFRTPHALVFDSKGRLIVADRHNHRIQVLTKAGKFILEYDDFGRTSGLAIDKNDVIYTTDSESTEKVHPGWQRGIRIGSLKDGKVTMFIPPHMTPDSPDGAMGEGIAIDAAGNIYTAEAQLRGVTKYVKK